MEQLANFRATYPHCTLVSEFAGVEHGQYIVRCRVEQVGHCVVASLSAASTVEAAEEQARDRALALLAQIGVPPVQMPIAPIAVPSPVSTPTANPVPPSPPPEFPKVATPTTTPAAPEPSPPEPQTPPVSPMPIASTSSSNGERPASVPEPVAIEQSPPPEPEPLPEAPPRPPTPQPQVLPNGAIDFTDIIARTNREMKRLGWTTEQGRSYLVQTYGKPSRTRLDDHELQEFLAYLESQS